MSNRRLALLLLIVALPFALVLACPIYHVVTLHNGTRAILPESTVTVGGVTHNLGPIPAGATVEWTTLSYAIGRYSFNAHTENTELAGDCGYAWLLLKASTVSARVVGPIPHLECD
jgi:hypothetical protein